MKKKLMVLTLSAIMLFSGIACGNNNQTAGNRENTNNEREEENNEVTTEYTATNLTSDVNKLTLETSGIPYSDINALSNASTQLLGVISEEEGDTSNVLLSPTSIMMAFGMLENGASGDTLSQMETVINGGLSIENTNPVLYDIYTRFNESEDVTWNVANSIWLKNDGNASLVPDFLDKAASYYGAEVWMANFDQSTVDDINNWVNEETLEMIPHIIDDLSPNARMCLINAIAFEGEWEVEYTEDDILEDGSFTNADGTLSEVPMLFSEEDNYFTLGDGIGFMRPYKGGEYSFVGILPNEGMTVNEYIASIGDESFAEAIANREYGEVYVKIPEFTTEFNIELSETLQAMGIESAFTEDAEFTNLLVGENGEEWPVCISKVIHKTFIEVNREGTRAAAVTAIEMEDCALALPADEPIWIELDRPFVYAIVDNATGLPVFLGTMNTIE